jgi:hypothetical protein
MDEFKSFVKIPRLSRNIVVTEKIDGTNAQIIVSDDGKELQAGSRTKYIDLKNDNFGFAKWVEEHKEELLTLGPGRHFGEWWGLGIQRGYGLKEKRFSLFNTALWGKDETRPKCCGVVPVLYEGPFSTTVIDMVLDKLANGGSVASPRFMKPEGVVIFHTAGGYLFKKTIEKDDQHKGE